MRYCRGAHQGAVCEGLELHSELRYAGRTHGRGYFTLCGPFATAQPSSCFAAWSDDQNSGNGSFQSTAAEKEVRAAQPNTACEAGTGREAEWRALTVCTYYRQGEMNMLPRPQGKA